ncbi:hypothetical protein DNTS_031292 [Danionella cerebrum]|uniref:Uncharacterized protein n=1 Tax=Danionella cerebrum TaxID=2873325 RepID=A0A553Q5Y0_9TELE|nr:hypothetical protein DNTS_031292 [Danionella translucida]
MHRLTAVLRAKGSDSLMTDQKLLAEKPKSVSIRRHPARETNKRRDSWSIRHRQEGISQCAINLSKSLQRKALLHISARKNDESSIRHVYEREALCDEGFMRDVVFLCPLRQ